MHQSDDLVVECDYTDAAGVAVNWRVLASRPPAH